MNDRNRAYLIVNFGGPRDLNEVEEFLICLFKDQEVLRTPFPAFIHNYLFTKIAKKRSRLVVHDYSFIGGKSPIYEDTEEIARQVARRIDAPVITFHRYLPKTHEFFLETMSKLSKDVEIRVFPMFPQFSYATTGSIAQWFVRRLDKKIVRKMVWVKSYPTHAPYVIAFENCIREFLQKNNLCEAKTILLFSAHGVPKAFITTGDIYERECQVTFRQLAARFPQSHSHLCYQSQFGTEEWIRPYTSESCLSIDVWGRGYDNVVIIPLSFSSDHIETLFEVEQLYFPPIVERGFKVFRCPALNRREEWVKAIADMMIDEEGVSTEMLLRK